MKNNKQKNNKKQQNAIVESLDTKIAKAVYAEKKISERIVGYFPYEFQFVKATYFGTTQRPAKISAIEKGIVGILLIDGHSSFGTVGQILGLDVVNDKAEKSILSKALDGLRSFNAIEGNDDFIVLTEAGKVYADKGERPDTYQKSFDIFVDMNHTGWKTIKNALSAVNDNISFINTKCENISLNIDEIREYAAVQAQDVHYPQERYLLERADWKEGHKGCYKMYICFVQGVSTGVVRAFAFDENTNSLNPIVAEYINSDATLASQLLEQCIKIECEMNFDTQILDDEAAKEAKAKVSQDIIEAEKRLADEDTADEETDEESVEKSSIDVPNNEVESSPVKKTKPAKQTKSTSKAKDRLHKKALYDSVSFEVELQKIFKEDNPDEIWLMSPWIKGLENKKSSVFIDERGPAIETFLQDEKKRVFVAYSAPSQTKSGKLKTDEEGNVIKNIDDDVLNLIEKLEKEYPNFFFVELPEYHFKNVIEVKGDQKILFSGSFNVLSFSVSEHQTHVRREEMALANPSIAKSKYVSFQVEFAEKYAERIKQEIEELNIETVDSYVNERMNYFLNIDNSDIKKLYLPMVELLEEKKFLCVLASIRKRLTAIDQQLAVLANTTGITGKKKSELKRELEIIEKDMNVNSVDDPSLTELLSNNRQLLEHVKEQKIFPGKKKNFTTSQQQRQAVSKSLVSVQHSDILNEEPETTKEGLSLYLARISQAFMNKEIKKTPMNENLLALVQDSELVNLMDMLTVMTSRYKDNAFDLSIGVNGYLFRYPTLFNYKEEFAAKQKRTQQRLTQVNQSNIQTVVKQLS